MINLGILGCAEIAFRRFMPAALGMKQLNVIAVAEEYDKSKLDMFCSTYGIEGEKSFAQLIERKDIDAVYVPQPPALHYKWAKRALENGKHVLVEKPSTMTYEQTADLVLLARKNGLALHENYMFQYHSQITEIKKIVDTGQLGDLRLLRASFGFPLRSNNDFRYNAELGGGALLDAGGYTAKLATIFLGKSVHVDVACLHMLPGYEVDMYGSATFSNEEGLVCQVGFGMDCAYRCSLEVWGSKSRLTTNRIFTAPPEYHPSVILETADGVQTIELDVDSHFLHSIEAFCREVIDEKEREIMYEDILVQARLVEDMRK